MKPNNQIISGQFDDVENEMSIPSSSLLTASKTKVELELNFFVGYQPKVNTNDFSDENSGDVESELELLESKLLGENSALHKIGRRINVNNSEFVKNANFSSRIQNDIIRSEKKSEKRPNYYGRDDRATSEQVLDPRTRLILFKLLSNSFISEIDGTNLSSSSSSYYYYFRLSIHYFIIYIGCLSTGKEANVYYAKGSDGQEYAVKIFKTSILVFKDRDRYVSGEYRFRNGYCKSNPRKMVRTWAEKEMRNLKRLVTAGILCPVPRLSLSFQKISSDYNLTVNISTTDY
jgi:hypothetical protein